MGSVLKKIGGLFKTPKAPKAPPPPPPPASMPTKVDDQVRRAREEERKRRLRLSGRAGTVLTGSGGVEAGASTTTKRLLGE